MSGPMLSVGRGVIVDMARLAALEVPGRAAGRARRPDWRAFFRGPPVVGPHPRTIASTSGSGSSPDPGRTSRPSAARCASQSPVRSSGCSASSSAR